MSPALAAPQLSLEITFPKMLSSKEELRMVREAYARDPKSIEMTIRLAAMLVRQGHTEEAIALLESGDLNDFRRLSLLQTALAQRGTPEANRYGREIAARACALADTDARKAQALAARGRFEIHLGDTEQAEVHLREAFALDPENKDAYKRLIKVLADRDPEEALVLAKETREKGLLNCRVLGSIPMLLSRLGRFDEAHEAEAFEKFHLAKQPAPPVGWSSLDEFNEALAAEILNHPDIHYQEHGEASIKTWRVDDPLLHRSKIFPQLLKLVQQEVLAYAESLVDSVEPMALACPSHALLRSWCVVTQGEGHEAWHVHQGGWVSGVYYIHVQDHIVNGTGREGCISFGMSDEFVGKEASAEFGETIVRPYGGLFMIFPSYSSHRTYPHFGPGHRICFAFDVVPQKATQGE